MQLRKNLNFWSSCLHYPSARITGVYISPVLQVRTNSRALCKLSRHSTHRIQNQSQNYTEIQILKKIWKLQVYSSAAAFAHWLPCNAAHEPSGWEHWLPPQSTWQFTAVHNSSPGGPNTLFWCLQAPAHMWCRETHEGKHSHTWGWGEGSMVKSVYSSYREPEFGS